MDNRQWVQILKVKNPVCAFLLSEENAQKHCHLTCGK